MKRKAFLTALALLPVLRALGNIKFNLLPKSCRTQADQEGPFYKDGSPARTVIETEGSALIIRGRVLKASDCKSPVANALVDVWHCDSHGNYDNEGFKCRGLVRSAKDGSYSFKTIYPPSYGSRPRHIHFKVRAKGFPELTSQIYFKGDPNLNNDFARNAEESRVIPTTITDKTRIGHFDVYI